MLLVKSIGCIYMQHKNQMIWYQKIYFKAKERPHLFLREEGVDCIKKRRVIAHCRQGYGHTISN